MKTLLHGLVLCAVLVAASLGTAQPCQGQVVLSEILGDPAQDWDGDATVDFKADEWVEITNLGLDPVPLDSLRLSDASDTFRFGFQGTLSPGSHLVVYGSDSVAWETSTGHSTVGLSLNNGGDTVRLWQLAGAETLLVDAYTYAAHEAEDDRSTALVDADSGTWMLFDVHNPYTGTDPPTSTGCPPTPSGPNVCPTAVEEQSWGAVKRLFRDRDATARASGSR
jgi:hypothetical protein